MGQRVNSAGELNQLGEAKGNRVLRFFLLAGSGR